MTSGIALTIRTPAQGSRYAVELGDPYANVRRNALQTFGIEYRGRADFKRDRVWNDVRIVFREAQR